MICHALRASNSVLSARPSIAPFGVIGVAHGESPHFQLSHLKDHMPKLIVVDGGHIKTAHSLTGPLNSVLYDPSDVSHPRVDVF